RDLFGSTFGHDAPADARLRLPAVHFEGDRPVGHLIQLRARAGAKDDDPPLHAVVDREDLDPAVYVERDSTAVNGAQPGEAVVLAQHRCFNIKGLRLCPICRRQHQRRGAVCGTNSTEERARCSTPRATLPRSSRARPVRPRVPITIRSVGAADATMPSVGDASMTCAVAFSPAWLSRAAASRATVVE